MKKQAIKYIIVVFALSSYLAGCTPAMKTEHAKSVRRSLLTPHRDETAVGATEDYLWICDYENVPITNFVEGKNNRLRVYKIRRSRTLPNVVARKIIQASDGKVFFIVTAGFMRPVEFRKIDVRVLDKAMNNHFLTAAGFGINESFHGYYFGNEFSTFAKPGYNIFFDYQKSRVESRWTNINFAFTVPETFTPTELCYKYYPCVKLQCGMK